MEREYEEEKNKEKAGKAGIFAYKRRMEKRKLVILLRIGQGDGCEKGGKAESRGFLPVGASVKDILCIAFYLVWGGGWATRKEEGVL